MPKVSVIIPNYNGIKYIEDCLNSLRNQTVKDFDVWVIDNASTDGSGEYVKNALKDMNYATVIVNDENFGFARGNNVGYKYAKTLNPDFMIIMNNDVVIRDEDFLIKIEQSFIESNFYVLGPDIVSKRGQTSPIKARGVTASTLSLMALRSFARPVTVP